MKHVDMRKLPAAAQEEHRRQVIGLRQAGMTYDEIAAQVGLSATGMLNICQRYAERGAAGLKTGPRGPEPRHGRFLGANQEAATRDLDRLPVHRSAKVRDWLIGREAKIEVFFLPGYSPELNSDEGVNGDQLKRAVISHMRRLSKLPGWVRSFFGHRTFRYAA
jgi:hypothetical protein